MRSRIVDELGMMREQYSHGIIRNILHRRSEIGFLLCVEGIAASKRVINACDIEAAAPLDMLCPIQYDAHLLLTLHALCDGASVVIVFMIADTVPNAVRIVLRMGYKHLLRGFVQSFIIKDIAGHREKIRTAACDLREQRLKFLHREICAQMHIADLRDQHPVRLVGQAAYRDFIVSAHGMMPLDKCAVAAEQKSCRRIKRRIFENAPSRRIVRNLPRFSHEETQPSCSHHGSECDQLPNKEQNDRQYEFPCPAVCPMRTEQKE